MQREKGKYSLQRDILITRFQVLKENCLQSKQHGIGRHTDQWNRIERKELKPYNGEKKTTSINCAGKTGEPHAKE